MAQHILEQRYLAKNERGEMVEDVYGMWRRVAGAVAAGEADYWKWYDAFYSTMSQLDFLPNSPTLMNAGTGQGTLSACFVLPLEDSMEGITECIKQTALVQKFGGGTGVSLSSLREAGAPIATTHGKACGPIAVLKVLSAVSTMITQGGKRDGANMAVMKWDHPDIMDFVMCKEVEGTLANFNVSVGVTDDFMAGVLDGNGGPGVNPLYARRLWDAIVDHAWANGEPGLFFLDTANRHNPTPHLGDFEATNPCGEQPLLPFESCTLGSINLANFVRTTEFRANSDSRSSTTTWEVDWVRLEATIRTAVRFLDNVIDINKYATPEIEEVTKATRKIGLGVMGWADMLHALGVQYDTEEAVALGKRVAEFLANVSHDTSYELGKERGWYPALGPSDRLVNFLAERRNACTTSIAPTGTISMIAGCSAGIEPYPFRSYVKQNVLGGEAFEYGAPDGAMTATEIGWEWHVRHQAAWQEFGDSGVSKTVNLPNSATREDVAAAYIAAWEAGCKGITVYRQGSREKEVLAEISYAVDDGPFQHLGTVPILDDPPLTADDIESIVGDDTIERPDIIPGHTHRVKVAQGTLYVTVNAVDGRPIEVLTTLGKSGSTEEAYLEAIARLTSILLQHGAGLPTIIKQLRGISDVPTWYNGVQNKSVPDAIAQVLGGYVTAIPSRVDDYTAQLINAPIGTMCPKCAEDTLVYQEGCETCYNLECGWSRCE